MPNLQRAWYAKSLQLTTILLLPFSWIFRVCVSVRRKLYRSGIFQSYHFNLPVIVVGNITVGGTGKTPFVIWLASLLQAQGYRPAIVSRGYAGERHTQPYLVTKNDNAQQVGDEAVLFATHLNCPVVVCTDRPAAVRYLAQQTDCNIVLSDDGLQHYALQRNIEIAIVDGEREFGNRQLLPAGPLREPIARLKQVDFVVTNAGDASDNYVMMLEPVKFTSLLDSASKIDAATAKEFFPQTVHAIAGIGHPERFFNMLKALGLNIIPHVFPDHHAYTCEDLEFNDGFPVIMTEKDAVKCRHFAKKDYWFLAIQTKITNKLEEKLLTKIKAIKSLEVEHVNKESFSGYFHH